MIKKDFKLCPISKFIAWLILGLIVCIIGISNVFALTNENRIQFYDNSGSSLSLVSTSYISQTGESNATFSTSANSYGGAVLITLDQPLISGYIYTIFINVGAANMGGSTRLSSKNCVGLGSGSTAAINSYINCNITPKYSDYTSSTGDKTRGLYFTFIADTNGIYLLLPYTSQYTCTNCLQYSYGYELNVVGDSNSLSQSEVNNVINNQTNIIQNQINSLNNNINDTFQTCSEPTNVSFTTINGYELDSTGNLSTNTNWLVTDYIQVHEGDTYSISGFSSSFVWYYDNNKNFISRVSSNNITIPSGVYYIRKNSAISSYNGVITKDASCINKLDEQTDAINSVNDSINNDSVDSSSWSNFFNNFTTNTFGLTSIITAPLNLIQSLTSTSCTDLQLPLPYLQNKYLTLPCMTSIYSQYFGNLFTLYQTITYGIIAYWVCVRIFNLVKDFKNPDHDEIEVVDL